MLFILISTCLAQLIIPNIEQGIAPAPVVGIVGNIPSAPLIQAPGTKKEDNHVPHLHNDAFGEFIFDVRSLLILA